MRWLRNGRGRGSGLSPERPPYQFVTLRLVKYLWDFKFTMGGRYLLGLLSLSVIGTVTVQVSVYQFFFSLGGLLVGAVLAGYWKRPRLRLTGRFPDRSKAGQPVTALVTITNLDSRPAHDVSAGLFGLSDSLQWESGEPTLLDLPPHSSGQVTLTLRPLKRGLYPLPDLWGYTSFPFHLVRSRRSSSRQAMGSLLVIPEFSSLESLDIPLGARYQPGGIALTSNIGESAEYIGNREYVPGEPARRLDFRSWARLGKPVVREYMEEYYCRIALIVDTFIPAQRSLPVDGFPELEAAISLSAAIADALSHGEYLLDIFAAGPELYVFRAGRHTAHFDNVLEILACVDACRSNPFETIAPAIVDELGQVSTAICVFLDWDETRRQLVQTILEAGCSACVYLVRPSVDEAPPQVDDRARVTVLTVDDIRRGHIDHL